ncbi:hypothetical protein HNP55_000192 [Paucibacter oligotrophus]|uniref:Capsular polysaccharide synthesis protein n=1 Tax=Roseateles oligotrophus TaxID=1769250 RepID=A0A840L8I3_9BURK|nr:capsular polysaccharide synthesis protein [Roseateles oligotrophus]MBB4841697.1 hypothetical protein [Roseateles oligotrophus]
MLTWLLLPLALLLLAATWELLRVLRAQVPASVHRLTLGQPLSPTPPAIPKIIWAYWHATPAPDFIQQCQANWQRFAPDHELRLLHQGNMRDWVDGAEQLAHLDALPHYRQADWLRLQLLARHGGLWVDASILLCQNLDWVHQTQQAEASEFVGFYINRFTTRPDQPIVENWFMAAVPGSRFVGALAQEFELAIGQGEAAYLAGLQQQGKLARVVQGLGPKDQSYLIMHVAAAVVLDRQPQAYRLALTRAEDSAFAFHTALGWRKRHLYARLALSPCPARLPCLIKLRGGDRRVFERGLARQRVLPGSALARLLPRG